MNNNYKGFIKCALFVFNAHKVVGAQYILNFEIDRRLIIEFNRDTLMV
jgi:hypothetical protein